MEPPTCRRRRELYREVADWLECEEPESINDLARHLIEARENARALPYVVVADDQAAHGYAMRETIGWYRRALDIVEPVGDVGLACQAYEGLGAALQFTSDIPAALKVYEEMEAFARSHDATSMLVSALNKQGSCTGRGSGTSRGWTRCSKNQRPWPWLPERIPASPS